MSSLLDKIIENANKSEYRKDIAIGYEYFVNNTGEHNFSLHVVKNDREPSVVRLTKSTLSKEEAEELMVSVLVIDGIDSAIARKQERH